MNKPVEMSRNSKANEEFEAWKNIAWRNLNHVAGSLVEEQKQMITALIVDPQIEFRVKLQLLEKHTGKELYLDEACGLAAKRYEEWKMGESIPPPNQQVLILQLCQSSILEWLEERAPLEQIIGITGLTEGVDLQVQVAPVPAAESTEPGFEPVAEVPVSPTECALPFDPAIRISDINLSCRAANCLKNQGIMFLAQLVDYYEAELLRIPQFGRQSLNEVKVILSDIYGARLGMEHPALTAFLLEYPPHKPRGSR